MGERIWSPQQVGIFSWFGTSEIERIVDGLLVKQLVQHLVVRARAGTGKTTTILEAINYAPESTILLAAFNKRIADHLKMKLQNPRAEAKTLHSVGLSFVTERWGYGAQTRIDDGRADDLTLKALDSHGVLDAPFAIIRLISKLHTKAREIRPHAKEPEDLLDLVDDYDCEPDEEFEDIGMGTTFVTEMAIRAMFLAMVKPTKPRDPEKYKGGIDFADMIFLPIRNKWLRPKYELVVVDEAQDMSASQLEIAQGVCSGRICVVGDDRQAIYGFRGADSNSIDRLKTVLKAGELGLTTTYRCGKVITRHNARIVPDFQHHEDNHEGVIRGYRQEAQMIEEAEPGDFILSRKNAPIAGVAMALIRANKRVVIAGRDIGKGLQALAKKLATGGAERSIPLFLQKLDTWKDKECKRALKSTRSKDAALAKCEAIQDKAETMIFLVDGIASVRELHVRLETLFRDTENPATVVTCSSIHKAKGLEADRVFVLMDTLYPKAFGGKMSPARRREEENLDYVACTRAIRELVLVGESAGNFTAVLPLEPTTPERVVGGLAPFEPTCEKDIDDKAEFDALSAAVAEVEGLK